MKNLEFYNVTELSSTEIENTNGGMAALGGAAIAAKVGCGLLVLGAGVVVGAVAAYGAYRLVKWMVS